MSNELLPLELGSTGSVPWPLDRLVVRLDCGLARLLSPGTFWHTRVDWSGGGTSQDDDGCLDPLPLGLALRDVDLGELDGVDVRGPDLIGVLGRKSFPV